MSLMLDIAWVLYNEVEADDDDERCPNPAKWLESKDRYRNSFEYFMNSSSKDEKRADRDWCWEILYVYVSQVLIVVVLNWFHGFQHY